MAPRVKIDGVLMSSFHYVERYLSGYTYILLGLILITVLVRALSRVRPEYDPREPPLVAPRIPVIGHNVAILRDGPGAWLKIHTKRPLPIATLPSIGGTGRLYMVTDPRLITAVFASSTLEFAPILMGIVAPFAKLPPRQARDFQSGMFLSWVGSLPRLLSGRRAGREVTSAVLADLQLQLESIAAGENSRAGSGSVEIQDIGIWARDVMSRAVLKGLIGHVPWAEDPRFIQACWDFEHDLDHYVISPNPKWTAPKSYKAREHILDVLSAWLASSSSPSITAKLSPMAASLLATADALPHWTHRDRATLLLFLVHVALSNVVQTAWWFFAHVYADTRLVAELRAGVDAALLAGDVRAQDADEGVLSTGAEQLSEIVQPASKTTPLLKASLLETQRVITSTPVIRSVTADTVISDKGEGREYLLKKGALVFAPRTIVHRDEKLWGTDGQTFRPERFFGGECAQGGGVRGSFFPYGGGREICPGRHLATTTILAMVAMLLEKIDVIPDQDTPIEVPEPGTLQLTTVVWRIPQKTEWRGRVSKRTV